ncbi:DUF6138 family protein [Paenibacillus silvae]|uniref:DUF6138 family protein n=1 Tax=Paenibacillus silvae TaxID=1325358 RepID=UPI002006D40C|nr:DUF6138 family protein [Paenibacillus silvae]MCK6078889.1 hypothetical protein [Paenibacillus silvae]MCK6153208.1 hypothetical protein [Paenibacillus silvae]MCK6271414.1 hypothetical protein [Paenibacillus silvae]
MTTKVEQALEEMIEAVHEWFDEQARRTDLQQTLKRTTLQMGIFDDIFLLYKPGRTVVDSLDMGWDEGSFLTQNIRFTEEMVRTEIQPRLVEVVQERMAEWVDTPLIDYRFIFRGKFPASDGMLKLTLLEYVNQEKRQLLLDRIHTYTEQKLENGVHPTKSLETHFLASHLLDPVLYPALDAAWIIRQYERIQTLNRERKEALAEHRHTIIYALTLWAERQFLPKYFDVQTSAYRENEYTLKRAEQLHGLNIAQDEARNSIELLLYAAVLILRFEPSYSKPRGLKFLELAKQLGSERAERMLTEGSGAYQPEDTYVQTKQVEGQANDVFARISIQIREESPEAYRQALVFIIRLLEQGFPKNYHIKLKSKAKQYLPVKGLAKSDTHRFFANALTYPELHPLLETYARAAMQQFEFYADTEGEKNGMPGSYAAFGLGLANEQYFPLINDYMDQVDDEHQMIQDKFIAAFVEKYGVTAHSMPVLVNSLRRSTDGLKLKVLPEFEHEEKLALLLEQVQKLESFEVQRVLYPIFGKLEKLVTLARKADGRRKELLLALARAGGK